MSSIEINNLNFNYGQQTIFDHAQININDQWRLGLVGRNGRGKTTLLNILRGTLPVDSPINTTKQFEYFPQPVQNETDLTYDVLKSLADFELWEIERELSLMGADLEMLWRPFDTLSGGEQTKALLVVLFLAQNGFALIDEPTNHLDAFGRQLVADYLAKQSSYIVVSHDREFLNQVTDHILAIERTQIRLYQGNFATYESEKELRDDFEQAENAKLRNEIGRLQKTARDKATWSQSREGDKYGQRHVKGSGSINDTGFIGARAARVMKKAKHLEKRMQNDIKAKSDLLKDIEAIEDLTLNFVSSRHQVPLRVEELTVSYQTEPLFKPVSFELARNQVIAITGANGRGKSSLLQVFLNEFTGSIQGNYQLPQSLKMSTVRQITNYHGTLADFAKTQQIELNDLLANLKKLGMDRIVFKERIENMSMGQQKKVELARSLATPAELYIWDEPLNYLDVFNHDQLAKLIQTMRPTMLLIEHDRDFINQAATDIVELTKP